MKKIISAIYTAVFMLETFGICTYAEETNMINVSFGDKLTLQEENGYVPYTGETMLDNFYQAKAELPDEVPVLEAFEVRGSNIFFVSPDGNDEGSGTEADPFATAARALYAVSELTQAERDRGSVIYFRAGTYSVSETEYITSAHTSDKATLFLASYPGEKAIFSGEKSISLEKAKLVDYNNTSVSDLRRINKKALGNLYYIDYTDAGISDMDYGKTLYLNGAEMIIARYPNQGSNTVKEVIQSGGYTDSEGLTKTGLPMEWIPDDDRVFSWRDTGSIHLVGRIANEWSITDGLIKIDKGSHSIKSGDSSLTPNNSPVTTQFWNSIPSTFYYANVFEELDMPGEWYADDNAKRLYFCAPDEGFSGNGFITYEDSSGYVFDTDGAQNVVFDGIDIKSTQYGIRAANGCRIIVQNCGMSNMEKNAFVMANTEKCGMLSSTAKSIAKGSALVITQSEQRGSELVPRRNFVQNSYIYDCAGALSVSGCSSGNIISHNLFMNTKYSCITLNGAENIFEYNEFSGVANKITDAGAIYVGGNILNRANTIRYNYIHDSNPNKRNARAIYNDDCSDMSYNYGNVIKNFGYGLFQHSGDDHIIMDNTVINCSTYIRNSQDYAAQKGLMVNYFFKSSPGYISGYSSYSAASSPTWKRRYQNIVDDKYNEVLDARAAYTADPDMYSKVQQVLQKKKSASDYDNAADVQKVCDLVADTGCYYIGNTLVAVPSNKYGYGPSPYGLYNVTEPDTGGVPEQYVFATAEEADAGYDISEKIRGMGVLDTKPADERAPELYIHNETQLQKSDFTGLSWTKSPYASYYTLEIATDSQFQNTVVSYTSANTEFPVLTYKYNTTDGTTINKTVDYEFLTDTVYYARVTAKSAAVGYSDSICSAPKSFVLKDRIDYGANASNGISMIYNSASGYVHLSGTVPDYLLDQTDRQVTVTLYDSAEAAGAENAASIKYIRQITPDENNKFSDKFKVPKSTENMMLRVRAAGGDIEEFRISEHIHAVNEEAEYNVYLGMQSGYMNIEGTVPAYLLDDADRQISVILYEGDNAEDIQNIRYIRQINPDSQNKFSCKFLMSGDQSNIRIKVRAAGNDITDELLNANVIRISEAELAVSEDVISANDIVSSVLNINNMFGYAESPRLIMAAYDSDNRLIDVKEYNADETDSETIFGISGDYTVPQNASYIKAYAWSTVSIKALTDSVRRDTVK